MNLVESLLGNPELLRQVASSLGVGEADARSGIESLVPAVARGVQQNARRPEGFDALRRTLESGNHQQYVDHPEVLGTTRTRQDGDAILGHVFGSKDVSRNVARSASEASSLDTGQLQQLLPIVAAAVMGALGKRSAEGGLPGGPSGARGGDSGSSGFDLIASFLDADRDGSVLDDVLGLAKKFL